MDPQALVDRLPLTKSTLASHLVIIILLLRCHTSHHFQRPL